MKVRPAGREDCGCRSPYNKILEQLDALASDIASAADIARDAYDVANAQAGQASQYAQDARDAADDALLHAQGAQQSADDALVQAAAAAGSASDAADSAADAALEVQNIQQTIATVLAQDIGAKLDKLETAGVYAYTHAGSTQGQLAVDATATASTIMARDSNGYAHGATVPTGTYGDALATSDKVINELNAYAPMLRSTGNQRVSGIKVFNAVPGIIGHQTRVTGTTKLELFRYSVNEATNSVFNILAHSRSVGIEGKLYISYNGANITLAFQGIVLYGSASASCFYVYLDGTEIVVCFGNQSSTNNHFSISYYGGLSGAGLIQPIDFSYLGSIRTSMIDSNTPKYVWGSV